MKGFVCQGKIPMAAGLTVNLSHKTTQPNILPPIPAITSKDIKVVEVGAYNMPSEVVRKSEDVVGKYASAEMIKGEYVLAAKISDTPASENAYLYNLTGEKRAISITIPSFAGGLSGKLIGRYRFNYRRGF